MIKRIMLNLEIPTLKYGIIITAKITKAMYNNPIEIMIYLIHLSLIPLVRKITIEDFEISIYSPTIKYI